MKYLHLLFLASVLFTGCNNNEARLTAAEQLMVDVPDSALTILQSIPPDKLHSRSAKAKYGLLYSQALDKNYIDLDRDTLIRPAADYYSKHGDLRDKYLSLYYLGRVQCNAQDYTNAIISFTQAAEYAEKQEDHYYLGLIYTQIGDIQSIYYNYPSSIEAYNEAQKHYCMTSYKKHQQYALLNMAFAYAAAENYDESLEVLTRILDDPQTAADTSFLTACLSQKALIYYSRNQISQAKDVILSIPNHRSTPLSLSDYLILAHIYAIENKQDSTELCLNAARASAATVNERASITLTESKINECTKNYFKAYQNLEQCMHIQDSIARLTLSQSVTSAQRDYYEHQSIFAAYRLRTNRLYLILIVLIAVLVITVLTLYFRHIRKMKDMEIAEYMAMACKIQDTLQSVKQDNNLRQSQMSDLIQHLFKEQFELINRLGITYYEKQNTKSEQDAIFNEVKIEINKLGSNKKAKQELERIVNGCRDNVMQKIREQMPEIKEQDFELLNYIFAGFSYRAISIFTQDTVDNIYTRKSRLKSKIQKSDVKDKDLFCDMMC